MCFQRAPIKRMAWLFMIIAIGLAAIAAFGVQIQTARRTLVPQELPPLIRSVNGADLYRAYCASCHGKDARGGGPAAAALKAKVPDLTVLARNHGGQFPEERVSKFIMGDETVPAHGTREMPVWGPVFHQVEDDVDRGPVRIANLVQYLKSIQAPK